MEVIKDKERPLGHRCHTTNKNIFNSSLIPPYSLILNLPKKSGSEVLEEIKNDKSLLLIPVVILTSSAEEMDVVKTYCYITKPVNMEQFVRIVNSIQDFWFAVVKLPPT